MRNNTTYCVYIVTNVSHTVLYIGVTNDLESRLWQHKEGTNEKSFTSKYRVSKLIYYEDYQDIRTAIKREKQLKCWHRDWKIDLINKHNPKWKDLYKEFYEN